MAMNPAYVASKHGVLGLSRAIAVEMAPHNVRCNCIIPGFIETPAFDLIPEAQKGKINGRVPQRRMGSADELAEAAVFMLSPAASHITAQDWAVDEGTLNTLEVQSPIHSHDEPSVIASPGGSRAKQSRGGARHAWIAARLGRSQ